MYTKENVQDAYFAHRCRLIAEAEGCDAEAIATEGIEWYGDDNELDAAKTKELQAKEIARLQYGDEILKQARLVISYRYRKGTAHDGLVSDIAPTIQVPAGHIAADEAVRDVTLTLDAQSFVTPAEVAAATGTSESQWRNKAAAGVIPGAVKKGKQWLLPRSILA